MKLSRRRAWIGGLVLLVATGCCGEETLAKARTAANNWTPLDPSTLTALYAGKTWKWKEGAAYFASDGRFKAWSRSGGKLTEGFGTWSIRSDGGMCFTANWETIPAKPEQGAGKPVETCFAHQARGSAIAQMKLPNGPWYFFRRSPRRKTDEFFKLVPGDHTGLAGQGEGHRPAAAIVTVGRST